MLTFEESFHSFKYNDYIVINQCEEKNNKTQVLINLTYFRKEKVLKSIKKTCR